MGYCLDLVSSKVTEMSGSACVLNHGPLFCRKTGLDLLITDHPRMPFSGSPLMYLEDAFVSWLFL
jgi:hypothetical protein